MDALGLVSVWSPGATPVGVGIPMIAAIGYTVIAVRVRRGPHGWPFWRTVIWLLTCFLGAWTLAGPPTVFRGDAPVWDGVILGMVSAVLPLGIAVGDPIRLIERFLGRTIGWVRGRIARVIMFPGFTSLLCAVYLTLVVTSSWYQPGRTDGPIWAWALVGAFVTGLLVNVPLLSDDLLPGWATPPIRAVFAFADGIFDAVPGIILMLIADVWAGGALLALSEVIALPMIAVTIAQWVRADSIATLQIDAALDAQEANQARGHEPPNDGLWWKSDPRFADRFHTDN